jgi:hypothetical protein
MRAEIAPTAGLSQLGLMLLALVLTLAPAAVTADEGECEAAGDYRFLCGMQNAEDLVLVPGTHWIIASGMAPAAGMYLIDAQQKSWSRLYPADDARVAQDMETFGNCPGAPDPDALVTHGLNLRPGVDGRSTLYVVGHGGREAIEVFEVDASAAVPVVTWMGCVMLPEGMEANSVASFGDGSLVATVPLHPDKMITDAMARRPTGAVYEWSPGATGFTPIQGTEMPYANGIEVSADGREFYVASSGLFNVTAFSNSNPARRLRTTETFAFVPDNLHAGPDGTLITAGLLVEDDRCGDVGGAQEFVLEEFAACPRPFTAWAIDPQTMQGRVLSQGPAIEQFSNVTVALPVGAELWIGTFAGDRVAWHPLK